LSRIRHAVEHSNAAFAPDENQLTVFTWGYWGWGTAADRFVQAADAVEGSRGYEPPFFVDIRIRRSVRAPGFSGAAFENRVGARRHRWMKTLGNRCVPDGRTGIRIDKPEAAEDLLDLAIDRARSRQRILFFCACEFPGQENAGECHRAAVATLVLAADRRRGVAVQIEEWPGGLPRDRVDLTALAAHPIDLRRKSIVVRTSTPLAALAGLPWCSVGEVRPDTPLAAPSSRTHRPGKIQVQRRRLGAANPRHRRIAIWSASHGWPAGRTCDGHETACRARARAEACMNHRPT
jgi:hypothetical protein